MNLGLPACGASTLPMELHSSFLGFDVKQNSILNLHLHEEESLKYQKACWSGTESKSWRRMRTGDDPEASGVFIFWCPVFILAI